MAIKCPICHFDDSNTQKYYKECGAFLTSAEEAEASFTETREAFGISAPGN